MAYQFASLRQRKTKAYRGEPSLPGTVGFLRAWPSGGLKCTSITKRAVSCAGTIARDTIILAKDGSCVSPYDAADQKAKG